MVFSYKENYCQDSSNIDNVEKFHSLVSDLQIFYSCESRCHFYINEYRSLYNSIHLSLKRYTFENSHYSYLRGNLSNLSVKSENITELRQSIESNVEEISNPLCNYGLIDGVLRCISFCTGQCESNLTKQEIENIVNWLKPFSDKMEHNKLLKRQTARLS